MVNISSAAYGADGAEYRTERETWMRIFSHGVCGSGPCSFTVIQKDGATLAFGDTEDSRIEAVAAQGAALPAGSVRLWALNRQQDLNGNYILFQYTEQNGAHLPASVLYTGNATASTGTRRGVSFHYGDRAHPFTLYEGGAQIVQAKLLTAIQTCVADSDLTACSDANAVFTYELEHEIRNPLARELLTQITLTGTDGTQYPATQFTWQTPAETNGQVQFDALTSRRCWAAFLPATRVTATSTNTPAWSAISMATANRI